MRLLISVSEYEKILEEISNKLIMLNGYPIKNPANYQYEFLKEGKKLEPYQFRSFIHGNEDLPRKINSIVYIGISNQCYKDIDQETYDKSIIEGGLINSAVKSVLKENSDVLIRFENEITQIIIPQGAEEAVTILSDLVYDTINLINRKCRKHLNELDMAKKIYYYDVNVGLRRESFKEHLFSGAEANINLIYNHSPNLRKAALSAMRDF